MAICNHCAIEFDDSLPACSSCREPNPRWKADANASSPKKEEGPVPPHSEEAGVLGDHHIVFPRKEIWSWLKKALKKLNQQFQLYLLLSSNPRINLGNFSLYLA